MAICTLPVDLDLAGERWDRIRALHEKFNRCAGDVELVELSAYEASLQVQRIEPESG